MLPPSHRPSPRNPVRQIPGGSLRRGRGARRRWRLAVAAGLLGAAGLAALPATVHAQGQVGRAPSQAERPRPAVPPRPPAPPAPRPPLPLPGPETFAVPPKTPFEQWDAASYLIRTGQTAQAVPYLDAFLKANPDDETLIRIREEFGLGSILALQDDPRTRPAVEPLLKRVADALRRRANDPARLAAELDRFSTGTPAEQDFAVDQVRQAGSNAIPAVVKRLARPDLSPEDRALFVRNLGRLDSRAVPALIAALDAPNPRVAADVATALAGIGDRRALMPLTYHAARPTSDPVARQAAVEALARLNPRPAGSRPSNPAQQLAEQALSYHRHAVRFPADSVELWSWKGDAPAPTVVPKAVAEATLAAQRAKEAVELDPSNRAALVAQHSIALDAAARRGGPAFPAQDPSGAYTAALTAGPDVLRDVLRNAIADGHPEVAAVATRALAQVVGPANAALVQPTLVETLDAPDRRVQLAAARALVELDPKGSFPGASRVVPVLSRFAATRAVARPIVVDGNLSHAGNAAAALRALGYDPMTCGDGQEAFRLASESADVEFLLLDPIGLQGPWSWTDTLANLRADARTRGIPVFVTGALGLEDRIGLALLDQPNTAFLVAPVDPVLLQRALERELPRLGANVMSPAERMDLAQQASALLAKIAGQPGSPFAADLPGAEPTLSAALNQPGEESTSAAALADVPTGAAQQQLAEAVLDSSRAIALRQSAGKALTRSIRRFGPLVGGTLERQLLGASRTETDPALQPMLAQVVDALRPDPRGATRRNVPPGPTTGPVFLNAPAPVAVPATIPAPAPAANGEPPAAEPDAPADDAPADGPG